MERYLKVCVFILVILSFAAIQIALTQDKEDFVEASWERRLNRLQPPGKIMDAMDLKPGMVIGDIGAGRGRFAVWFADRVGETGKVYANDISERALQHLEKRCKGLGFNNVIICYGEVVDPKIPEGVLDIAFMINVYHHLDKPVELIKNIIPTLKSGGILVIVEHDPVKSGYTRESTSKKNMIKQAGKAGYELIKIDDFLKSDYIYFFRPKK